MARLGLALACALFVFVPPTRYVLLAVDDVAVTGVVCRPDLIIDTSNMLFALLFFPSALG